MAFIGTSASAGLIQLGAVMLLAALVMLWLKRRAGGEPGAVRSLRLTSEHALHVVRLGDRELLVGTGRGQSPTLLGPMPADAGPSGAFGLAGPAGPLRVDAREGAGGR